jgi:1-acyl-sn-glycerol-3-phosphate acyltransferase
MLSMEREPISNVNSTSRASEKDAEHILVEQSQGRENFIKKMRALFNGLRSRLHNPTEDQAKEQFIEDMKAPLEEQDTKKSQTGIHSFIQKMKENRKKRRSEPYINPPKLLRIPERSVDWLLGKMQLELTDQSVDNLEAINTLLDERSMLVMSNHQKYTDISSIVTVFNPLRNLRQMTGAAGMKHYDLRRDILIGSIYRMMTVANIRTVPVVQDDDSHSYPNELKDKLNGEFMSLAIKTIGQTKNQIVGITPEGTRVDNFQMIPFKNGIATSMRRMKDIEGRPPKVVPIAIIYKEITGTNKGVMHIGTPFHVDELFTVSEDELDYSEERIEVLKQQRIAFDKIKKEKSDAFAHLLQFALSRPMPPYMKENVVGEIYEFFEKYGVDINLLNWNVTGLPAYENS